MFKIATDRLHAECCVIGQVNIDRIGLPFAAKQKEEEKGEQCFHRLSRTFGGKQCLPSERPMHSP